MRPSAILESALYVTDLAAAEAFYRDVLGLEPITQVEPAAMSSSAAATGVLLLFNAEATAVPPAPDARLPVPPHGAHGHGHLCFAAERRRRSTRWRSRLEAQGVAIEADFEWPNGGRSIYFRDPSGNSIEFAEPTIWGIRDARCCDARKIVVASHNAGKLREFADLMAPFGLEARSAKEFGLRRARRDRHDLRGERLHQGACRGAWPPACRRCRTIPACVVDALDGAPGVYTANWAETPDGSRDFGMAMQRTEDAAAGDAARSSLRDARPLRRRHLPCLAGRRGRIFPRRGRRHGWSGRRAASWASATIRCSCRTAMTRPSAR